MIQFTIFYNAYFLKMVKILCGIIALGFIEYIPIRRHWRLAYGCKMLEKIEKSLQILFGIAPETHEWNDEKSIQEK